MKVVLTGCKPGLEFLNNHVQLADFKFFDAIANSLDLVAHLNRFFLSISTYLLLTDKRPNHRRVAIVDKLGKGVLGNVGEVDLLLFHRLNLDHIAHHGNNVFVASDRLFITNQNRQV